LPAFRGAMIFAVILAGCNNPKGENKSGRLQPQNPDDWVSLFNGKSLEGWEVTQFGTQGPVQVSNGSIILGMGDGCTGITWTGDFPKKNYEVSLEAKKISGNDFFCGMTFPVDESFCSLIIGGWGGPVVGLSTIDGLDGSENETRTLKKFEAGTWYHIRLKVSPEKIEAWIDDEKMVDFLTEGHKISIRPEVTLSRPFGICSWVTTAALREILLKE
jgi:hypothetical protein